MLVSEIGLSIAVLALNAEGRREEGGELAGYIPHAALRNSHILLYYFVRVCSPSFKKRNAGGRSAVWGFVPELRNATREAGPLYGVFEICNLSTNNRPVKRRVSPEGLKARTYVHQISALRKSAASYYHGLELDDTRSSTHRFCGRNYYRNAVLRSHFRYCFVALTYLCRFVRSNPGLS